MLIESAIDGFHRDCQAANLSETTRQRYRDDLGEFSKYLCQRKIIGLEEISANTLRDYVTYLLTRRNLGKGAYQQTQPLSPHTVDGRYRTVHRFFSFCMMERWIQENPMDRVRKPRVPKPIVARLEEGQVEKAIEMVEKTKNPQRNLALILLMIYSGLRMGEVLGLKLVDLNLEAGSVLVMGKGRKQRRVPINIATVHAFSLWLAVRPPWGGELVFVNRDGTPFGREGVRSLFTRLRKKLGLPRFYPHLLRHTFAAIYLKRVRDFKSLQKILGHARSSTTLDVYADFEDFETIKAMHTEAMGDRGNGRHG